jgi:hypothetical protein
MSFGRANWNYDLASIESKCTKMTANNLAKVASS